MPDTARVAELLREIEAELSVLQQHGMSATYREAALRALAKNTQAALRALGDECEPEWSTHETYHGYWRLLRGGKIVANSIDAADALWLTTTLNRLARLERAAREVNFQASSGGEYWLVPKAAFLTLRAALARQSEWGQP